MGEQRIEIVCIGGTFDHLHLGQEDLILKAFEVGESVVIGVSSDAFVESMRKGHEIQPYEERVEEIWRLLREKGLEERAFLVPLDDPYGPSVKNRRIRGIVVSEETKPKADEINKIRKSKGMRPLIVFQIDIVLAENGRPISSTRIRLGEIDREGRILDKMRKKEVKRHAPEGR